MLSESNDIVSAITRIVVGIIVPMAKRITGTVKRGRMSNYLMLEGHGQSCLSQVAIP
jgi:hypothetical protein